MQDVVHHQAPTPAGFHANVPDSTCLRCLAYLKKEGFPKKALTPVATKGQMLNQGPGVSFKLWYPKRAFIKQGTLNMVHHFCAVVPLKGPLFKSGTIADGQNSDQLAGGMSNSCEHSIVRFVHPLQTNTPARKKKKEAKQKRSARNEVVTTIGPSFRVGDEQLGRIGSRGIVVKRWRGCGTRSQKPCSRGLGGRNGEFEDFSTCWPHYLPKSTPKW